MIAVIDIGNSSIHFGIYTKKKLLSSFKLTNTSLLNSANFSNQLKQLISKQNRKRIRSIIVSSVNKEIEHHLKIFFKTKTRSLLPGLKDYKSLNYSQVKKYINYDYPEPETVGLDRWINYLAARAKYKHSFIIVDAGSATTLCLVNPKSEFCGGLIANGADMLTKAMHDYTDALPLLDFKNDINSYLGKNTKESILSACYFSYIHLCKGLVKGLRLQFRKDYKTKVKIIFTGGNGKLLFKKLKLKNSVWEPGLTLDGLYEFSKLSK